MVVLCLWVSAQHKNWQLWTHFLVGKVYQWVNFSQVIVFTKKNQCWSCSSMAVVFGGIYREEREVFMKSVPDWQAETLITIVKQCVALASITMLGEWRGYMGHISLWYQHQTVNHPYCFVGQATGAHIQITERLWRSAKEQNRTFESFCGEKQ